MRARYPAGMEHLSLVLAVAALVVAIAAFLRARAGAPVEDPGADARRRIENLREELTGELALQRRLLARVASGEPTTRAMIEDGRLWDDVDARTAHAPWKEGRWRALDVRTPQETARGILAGALLIPVDELEARVKELPKDGTPLLVYCASGGRSAAACEFLSRAGFEGLYNLEGGVSAWPHGTVKPG